MNSYLAVKQYASSEYEFPSWVDGTIDQLCSLHMYYNAFRQNALFSRSKTYSEGRAIMLGSAIHFAGDHNKMAGYALDLLLVSKCAIDVLQHYRDLSASYEHLKNDLRGQYPDCQSVDFTAQFLMDHGIVFLRPSLYRQIEFKIIILFRSIHVIIASTLVFAWHVFKTSMCLRDVFLLLHRDPRARFEACTFLVADCEGYQQKWCRNVKSLMEELKGAAGVIDGIFKSAKLEENSGFISNSLQLAEEIVIEEAQIISDSLSQTIRTVYHQNGLMPLNIRFFSLRPPEYEEPLRGPYWKGEELVVFEKKENPCLKSSIKSHLDFCTHQ